MLICNPRAGRGGALRALPEVRRHLEARALAHDVVLAERPGHATALARQAIRNGCRFAVAVGGDGTVREVVNGMIEADRALDPGAVLGVVAAGTSCDFVRTFGIPALAGHAVAHLDGAESFAIDVGKLTCESAGEQVSSYFCNVAEVGLGAEVVRLANRLPGWLGPVLYPSAWWMSVPRYRPAQATVDLVDRRHEGALGGLVVANCQFSRRGAKIAPRAAPTDGLLDVAIEHASRMEQIAMLPRVYRGEHLPHPDVLEAKRVRVSVEAERPLLVAADGAILGHTPAAFEVLRDELRIKV